MPGSTNHSPILQQGKLTHNPYSHAHPLPLPHWCHCSPCASMWEATEASKATAAASTSSHSRCTPWTMHAELSPLPSPHPTTHLSSLLTCGRPFRKELSSGGTHLQRPLLPPTAVPVQTQQGQGGYLQQQLLRLWGSLVLVRG